MMLDYRTNPEESPIAWCIQHQKFVPVSNSTKLMKSVFRVDTKGVFPYCVCNGDESKGRK